MPRRTHDAKSAITVCFFSYNVYNLLSGGDEGFGGAELDLYNIARELSEDPDFRVVIVTVTASISVPTRFGNIMVHPVRPAEVVEGDPYLKRRSAIAAFGWRLARTAASSKCDLYFAKLASPETMLVWLCAKLRRKPFVFRIGSEWETNLSMLRSNLFSYAPRLASVFIRCLKRMDLVIAQTKEQAGALERNYGVRPEVIYNAHASAGNISCNSSRGNVLWLGRAHPGKRPELFLQLAESMPDRQFVMVMARCKGYDALFEQSCARAMQLSNVTFLPGVPHPEVLACFLNARVFVTTSESEGFSNVLIEALKTGTPVISFGINPDSILMPASKSGAESLPLNGEAQAPLGFHIGDDIALAKRLIETLLKDQAAWNASSRAASLFAETHLNIRKSIDRYKALFRKLAHAPR